jgi:hypothetical protein
MKPEIISAYTKALTLQNDPDADEQERLQASLALDVLLGRMPWDITVMEVIDADEPPTWMQDDRQRASWLSARYLFEQIDEAIAK